MCVTNIKDNDVQEMTLVQFMSTGTILSDEASKLTGYTPTHVQRLAARGHVKAVKVGRVWFFDRESVVAYRATVRRGRKPKSSKAN